MVEGEGEEIPQQQDEGFREVLNSAATLADSLPDGSAQKVMWEQQAKAARTSPQGMRWHPALLRLCIALHAKSPSGYNLLRSSGFLKLPHENTLFNYTHFADTSPGNNANLLKHIMTEHHIPSLHNYNKNVCILMDEMKLKFGLFFTSSGKVVGFNDLGPVNNELKRFEDEL